MGKRSKICLYVFLICAFVALGILGYFVLYPRADEVRVGTKKFVTLSFVPEASSYELYASNDSIDASGSLNYRVEKRSISPDMEKFTVYGEKQGEDIAIESYTKTIIGRLDDGKVDCKISSYTVTFFSTGEQIALDDSVLEGVEGEFFCTAISEYLVDLFRVDGKFTIQVVPLDYRGEAIAGEESVVYYEYLANSEEDFLRRDSYYYDGEWLDYIIEDKEELRKLVWWSLLYRQASDNDLTFYIKTSDIDSNNINKLVKSYIDSYPEYDALEQQSVYSTAEGNIGRLTSFRYYLDDNFLLTYKDLRAMDNSRNKQVYNTALTQLHSIDNTYSQGYITRGEAGERNFAINDTDIDEVVVYNSEQLFMVIQSGARPVFIEGKSDVAKEVYLNALDVLSLINSSDSLTDYEKVTNIYRYICGEIVYDYVTYAYMQLKNDYSIKNFGNLSCFYLEGVFYDFGLDTHYAVCDGLSKAFTIMCNIEGIDCFKVNGVVGGGNHAWNRVSLIDESSGLDGEYYVDTTWGEATYESDGENYQLLTHTYFLFELDTKDREISYPTNLSSANTYDYYKNTFYSIDGTMYDSFIESDEELSTALHHYSTLVETQGVSVAELKMSSNYVNDKNSAIYKLNYTSKEIQKLDNYISSLALHIAQVEQQILRLKMFGGWGYAVDSYEQELAYSRAQLNQYNSDLEALRAERESIISSLEITSNYEWLNVDNVYLFKFYK